MNNKEIDQKLTALRAENSNAVALIRGIRASIFSSRKENPESKNIVSEYEFTELDSIFLPQSHIPHPLLDSVANGVSVITRNANGDMVYVDTIEVKSQHNELRKSRDIQDLVKVLSAGNATSFGVLSSYGAVRILNSDNKVEKIHILFYPPPSDNGSPQSLRSILLSEQ